MHCIHFFVFAFLGVASTTPIRNNVKEDLIKALKEFEADLDRLKLKAVMETSQKMIDSQRIQRKDVAKWQAFHDKMASCNETWSINGQTNDCVPVFPDGIEPRMNTSGDLYYYTNGALVAIASKYMEVEGQKHAELLTKVEKIIHEAGYTENDFDLFHNMYDTLFNELLEILKYKIINKH